MHGQQVLLHFGPHELERSMQHNFRTMLQMHVLVVEVVWNYFGNCLEGFKTWILCPAVQKLRKPSILRHRHINHKHGSCVQICNNIVPLHANLGGSGSCTLLWHCVEGISYIPQK